MDSINGYILLDKPAGITSARAVNRLKRLVPRGTKLGHAGTLDPFATGLLVVLIGKATKQSETIMSHAKVYEAIVKLGANTETDDPQSAEVPRSGFAVPGRPDLERAIARFVGDIVQKPPIFSALKVGGKRSSDRARAGQRIELAPRPVHVEAIDLLAYEFPLAKVRVSCGRGTYIRALARDLGESLSTGAYLLELRRTRTGDFDVKNSVSPEPLQSDGIAPHLVPLRQQT